MKNAKILHCLGSFDDGLSSHLCKQLIAGLGPNLGHSVVIATGSSDAARHAVRARLLSDFPQIDGMPSPGRLMKLAQAMTQYDLVLTYDYGALNVAMAHTAFSQAFGLPPLVHHEFGFGLGNRNELRGRRNWYRRIALGRASALIVPSERLEGLAITIWQQPLGRVRHLSPGVSIARKPGKIAKDALRGVIKRDGEQWIGVFGGPASLSDWQLVLAALRQLPETWQLIVAGEGAHLAKIREQAEKMELSHRVHLPGEVNDPSIFLGLIDIYLNLDAGNAFPFNALMAMGVGLPVAGVSGGGLAELLGDGGSNYVVEVSERHGLADVLIELASDSLLRMRVGQQNRARVRDYFDQSTMIDRFKRLYASQLGREL